MSSINSLLESAAGSYKNMQSDAVKMAAKWGKTGLLEGLGNEVEKNNMSMILENQAKQLVVEQSSTNQGGATFQVPTEVRADRKLSVGMKWLILYARKRGDKTMIDRLANEIMAAAKGEGAAVKKKDDTHRMAEANKAFSHFRF